MVFKKILVAALFILLVASVVACGDNEATGDNIDNEDEIEENDTDTDEDRSSDADDENEENSERESVETSVVESNIGEAPDDQGDLEVRLEMTVKEYEDHYEISGESNLLPGTRVRVRPTSEDYIFSGYDRYVDIEADGSFETELKHPQKYDTEIIIYSTVSPGSHPDEVLDLYGEKLENMEGPFVRVNYNTMTSYEYIAEASVAYIPNEDEYVTLSSEVPELNFPDDQGEFDVWSDDVHVERDDEKFYVTGRTNLKDAAKLQIEVDLPEYISFGYTNTTPVYPDGSFNTSIYCPDSIDEDAEMNIDINFFPYRNQMEYITEHYGEDGENLSGDLIESENQERQYIQLKLNLQ